MLFEDHVQLAIVLALSLPVAPDLTVPLPAGILRFALGKEAAISYGQEILDAGNELPDPKPASDLVVAQSLAGVEKIAVANEQFKKGKK